MKLTTSIVQESPRVINPDKQLALVLRNLGLSDLEFLPENFEAIDLSHNQLIELSLLEPCKHISTLIVSNNSELYELNSESFPNLVSLAAMNCNLKLGHIKTWKFPSLHYLVILNNPISTTNDYRLVLIHLFPELKTLDFKRVTNAERMAAKDIKLDQMAQPSAQTREQLIAQLKTTNDINEIDRIERLLRG